MYQVGKLFGCESVVSRRNAQIFEVTGIDNHKVTLHVVRPLKYLRPAQGDVQQMFPGTFFQHVAVVKYDSYQSVFFIYAHQSTLYKKTDMSLRFEHEAVGSQVDNALTIFVQFPQVAGQDILFILHNLQHIDNGLSNDICIQLKLIAHLLVHTPDAVFKINHNNADGPYIEQLFSNGVHNPYFLRYIGVHKAMFIV